MHPDVKVLLDVQELDKEAIELNSALAQYPAIWEETKKKLQAKRDGIQRAEANLDRHQKERKRIEQKLRLFSDDLRKFEQQRQAIKTPKEYEAINKQVEGVKAKITQLEEQNLSLISRDEEVQNGVGLAKEEADKFEAFAKQEKERIRVQFNDKKARIANLESEKARVVAKIDPEVFALYERINKRHPGSAIVPVRSSGEGVMRHSSCTGCHFSLLPNVVVLVHRGETIVQCPNCGRILAYDEDYVAMQESAVG